MVSTPFLLRVGLGLAATAVEQTVAVPVRTWRAVASIPALPVRLAGDAVQAYMHAGQQVTELAIKGDAVLTSVFPARHERPAWATFDEDSDDALHAARIYGIEGPARVRAGVDPDDDELDDDLLDEELDEELDDEDLTEDDLGDDRDDIEDDADPQSVRAEVDDALAMVDPEGVVATGRIRGRRR